MVSKLMLPHLLPAIIIFVFISCSNEKQETVSAIPEPTITKDTILVADTVKKDPAKWKPDFTGKYYLWTDHFKPVYFERQLNLTQVGDSVFGDFEMRLYYNKKELIGSLKGDVSGNVAVYGENPKYDANLGITVTERKLDSTRLSYNAVQFYVDHYFSGDVGFSVTYSQKKNTIEHNYAGGEWDTWEKSK